MKGGFITSRPSRSNKSNNDGGVFNLLLLGLLVKIEDWSKLKAGDDAMDAKLFNINDCPPLAFECHQKILNAYLKIIK